MKDVEYAGFWIRVVAALIDTALVMVIIAPLLTLIYGQVYWTDGAPAFSVWDLVLNFLFPAAAVLVFWIYKSATPGKIILKMKIVDAKTGLPPSTGQLIGRYLAYYVSTIPFLLGLIWVGIDERKQGWHDKLAGTLVIRVSEV